MKLYLFMKFSSVEEVEYLHHHEDVKDKSEVTRMNWIFFIDLKVILISINKMMSTISDCSSDHSIMPFSSRIISKGWRIKRIRILRNEILASKGENQDNSNLENRLTNDVFKHSVRNDVLVSWMRTSFE